MKFKEWLLLSEASIQEKTLYHGTLADYEPSIKQYGLQGGWHGPVGSFVASAYDDEDYGEPTEEDEVVFMTDKTELSKAVNGMVHHIGKKLNKDFHDVSDNDIRNHGLLVLIKDGDADADQYDPDDRKWASQNPPRGAETGDYFAPKMQGDIFLKGAALLRFLSKNGSWPRTWGKGNKKQRANAMRGKLGAWAISRGQEKEKALKTIKKAPISKVQDQLRTWE